MADYNKSELLICTAARQMEDGAICFIGTGVPMLAAALAKRTHAPGLVAAFEFGGIGPSLEKLPLAVGGSRTFHRSPVASSICDLMEAAARGYVEYGFLGGAQIDPYGNLNATVIGEHDRPKVRFPGSGGANDIGSLCWKTIAIMRHGKQRFVPKVDFLTTAGYLDGPGARERAGLPAGSGPYRVVSDMGLLGYDAENCRMKLLALQPGVSLEQVQAETGFELQVADDLQENPPPSDEELRLLREEIDPDHLYT
ncbi:MAG: 3-oxoacid CoA-transferase [Deltaproteobacteria bacterium]|nr:3-oxoacid CoA-transferase [Deltaproteobacteria bacterium]